MKLRFDRQSIRLRIQASELDTLSTEGFIEERLEFPESTFLYRLEIQKQPDISIRLEAGALVVILPDILARPWLHSDQTGIYADLPISNQESFLKFTLEKDFSCKH